MISDENGPTFADDAGFLYLGYSATEKIDRKEWEDRANWARKKWARTCRHDPQSASKAETT